MPASNTALRIAELDFDNIKFNLKNYLRSQNQFTDYDFEGSGINILLDILAYNTHYMSYYLNMIGNEMFLDSAILRNSVVSHAKHMNYMPSSSRAATAVVNVVIADTLPTSGLSSYTLPKYSEFQSQQIDGTNYTFVTTKAHTAALNVSSNTFTFSSIEIKQGEKLTYNVAVTAGNTKRRFLIPSANVDTTTLDVVVRASSVDTSEQVYGLADDTLNITSNSTVYFLEEDPSGQYAIYFGDGYIGKNLNDDNIVQLTYIDTSGEASNKANSFTLISGTGNFSNVVVNSVSASAGGAYKESIEKIKYTAPKYYTTQNRAVTTSDYEVLLSKDHPNIQAASVWGGEENVPVQYGKVFISLVPKAGYVITDIEKRRIIKELLENRNVVTITPEIVDPDYLYLKLYVIMHYDETKTILDENALKNKIKTEIETYSVSELEKFNATFRQSRLQKMLDIADNSFLSSDMKIELQKRFEPTLNEPKNYSLEFNTAIKRGTYKDRLYSYPTFTTLDQRGVIREAAIEETPLSYTGIQSIKVINAGYGYTIAPSVKITGDGSGARARAEIVNGRVSRIIVTTTGANYTSAVITLEGDGSGAQADAVLSTQTGTLRTYYIQENTGEKIIINDNAGTINYTTGSIRLIDFNPISVTRNPNYDFGVITINVESDEPTIHPQRNRILLIDNLDPVAVQVEMSNQAS
jgi:hypothetical protein